MIECIRLSGGKVGGRVHQVDQTTGESVLEVVWKYGYRGVRSGVETGLVWEEGSGRGRSVWVEEDNMEGDETRPRGELKSSEILFGDVSIVS